VPVPDVDVDRQEDRIAVGHRQRDRLVEHHVHPSRHDLAHLEGTHALLGHPVQGRRLGPVTAKSNLEESVTATGAGLDESSHRSAVTVERAHLGVARVGVSVEVDHRHSSPPDMVRDTRDVGQRNRVVPTQDDRNDTGARDGAYALFESAQ
jgi:hypothetical protein